MQSLPLVVSLQGYVSREEFSDALTDALNAQGSDAQLLYDKIDATGAEKFTLGKCVGDTL